MFKILNFENYITAVKNSIGSKIFRNMYIKVKGKKIDILENGDLSCAYFVTSILYMFGLIKEIHTTVNGTVEDLRESGWIEIKKPKIGSVLVWEKKKQTKKGGGHRHVGFYIGGDTAVSNSFKKGFPKMHHFEYEGKRKIEHVFHRKEYRNKVVK